jgi:hypothetical protein
MRTLIKIGTSLLLLALLLIALSFSVLRAQGKNHPTNTAGRHITSENRNLGKNIQFVDLNGPIEMTLRQGPVASLSVRGEQRLLGNIDTSQDGGTLHIGTKGMLLHHRQPIQVDLVLPNLEKLSFRGSGDSTVNGFSGNKMEIQLQGSGNVKFNGRFRDIDAAVHGSGDLELNGGASNSVNIELRGSGQLTVVGSCKEFKVEQRGSGELDAQHLTAEKVIVDMQGSGDASVLARQSADLTMRGSGDVSVFGSPNQRSVTRTGSGEVTFN